ncbi:hypothetical protein ATW97_07290 [Oenococcus oeni]|nr:hypothetical protein ATX10_07560 [Oenococcus oeni]OIM35091.1 hypothetical protein ATX70_07455 [Oenococcus oeni]OIM58132.1 hypothetical protein ATX85_09580 [Oenococcus oeni]OLQ30098.1 hypothetical protein ATW97_07290 [Oenococcus oeni]
MTMRRMVVMIYYKIIFGKKVIFGKSFRMRGGMKLFIDEGQITFGDNVFINNGFSASSTVGISIGDDALIGENVKIYDQNHVFDNRSQIIRKQGFKAAKVRIGNNCWIASNVTILAGVNIGDNVVIGANCLVYKNIPSNSVVKHSEVLIVSDR